MNNKFYNNGELQDGEIVMALSDAMDLYEDGAISEARDLLEDIVWAINEFEDNYEV